jgi:hypothetical protein
MRLPMAALEELEETAQAGHARWRARRPPLDEARRSTELRQVFGARW